MFFCFGLFSSVVSLQYVCFPLYIYISFFFFLFFWGGGVRAWFAYFASFRIVCVCVCVSVSVYHSVRVCLSVCLFVFVCVCVRVWNFVKWERGSFFAYPRIGIRSDYVHLVIVVKE